LKEILTKNSNSKCKILRMASVNAYFSRLTSYNIASRVVVIDTSGIYIAVRIIDLYSMPNMVQFISSLKKNVQLYEEKICIDCNQFFFRGGINMQCDYKCQKCIVMPIVRYDGASKKDNSDSKKDNDSKCGCLIC
jgi:hypothetical protein